MKQRDQRRALPARGDVAAAEIRHHVDAGQLSQQGRIVQLQGVPGTVEALRPVTDCLPVRADGGHCAGPLAGLRQQHAHHTGIDPHQSVGGECRAMQFVVPARIECQQLGPKLGRKGLEGVRFDLWPS